MTNDCYKLIIYNDNNIVIVMQVLLVCGELKHLMKQEGGRIEQLWRIWIWPSELPSKDGNLFLSMISRYVINNEISISSKN